MRIAEEKGKRVRTDGAEEDGGEPIDLPLLLSIGKLQEIQDEIDKVVGMLVLFPAAVAAGDLVEDLLRSRLTCEMVPLWLSVGRLFHGINSLQVNEEASDKVLEVEQKYNEIRKPVYVQRNEIIQKIPDFWLTAFLSHPVLGDLLTEDDQQELESEFEQEGDEEIGDN
ncbi:hypothetical protein C2845_PM15G10660 [Panicum miliaceum]|uniref:Uncharacterized protein n=1 Tax=Panicum miliaceum TaxID=4540 RepID=A0A3L6Q904_PANMI|nr:hypothetical protein C2845_PM15G10660 [Panicum miliaceum]